MPLLPTRSSRPSLPAPRVQAGTQLAVRPPAQAAHPLTKFSDSAHRKFPWLIWLLVLLLVLETLLFAGLYGLTVWTRVPLTGSVVDTSGQAVADVPLTVDDRRTLTDEFGNFELRDLPYGEIEVRVDSPPYEPTRQVVDLDFRTGGAATITLAPATGSVVQGRVIPIAGTSVSDYFIQVNNTPALLDAQGNFEAAGVPLGEAVITVTDLQQTILATRTLTVTPGPNVLDPIDLTASSTVTFTVRDWYTRTLLPGATVTLNDTTYTTTASGQVEVADWSAGDNVVTLTAPNYAEKSLTVSDPTTDLLLPAAGTLYYLAPDAGVSRLHAAHRDGSESRPLTPADLHVTDFVVEAGQLYFTAYDPTAARDSFDLPVVNVYRYDLGAESTTPVTSFRGTAPVIGGVSRTLPHLGSRTTILIEQTTTGVAVSTQSFDATTPTPALTLTAEATELVTVSDAIISPDGALLAILKQVNAQGTTQNSIRVTSPDGGEIDQNIILNQDSGLRIQGMLGFTADSQSLIFETLDGPDQLIQKFTLGAGGTQEAPGLNLNRYTSKIRGNELYYIGDDNVSKLDLDTLQTSVVLSDFSAIAFDFYGPDALLLQADNTLYYYDETREGFRPAAINTPVNFEFLR